VGGLFGLQIFRVIILTIIFLIFFVQAYKKLPFALLYLLSFLFIIALEARALLRPFIFNGIFIQVFLIILFSYQNTGGKRKLWILPILGILWANIHLGCFVFGNALIGIFLFANIIEYLNHKYNFRESSTESLIATKRKIKDLSILWPIFLCVFFFTPYGLEGFLYPFRSFFDKEFIYFHLIETNIAELQAPIFIIFNPFLRNWFLVSIALGIMAIWNNKKNRLIGTLLLTFATFLFLKANRGIDFLFIIIIYILLDTARAFDFKNIFEKKKYLKILSILMFGFLINISGAKAINFFQQRVYHKGHFINPIKISRSISAPKETIEFLKKNNIIGGVFNTDLIGGYLTWDGYPDLKPYIDGRQYNKILFSNSLHVIGKPEEFFQTAYDKYQFNIVILNTSLPSSHKLAEYLSNNLLWQLIFIEADTIVFIQKEYAHLNQAVREISATLTIADYSDEDIKELEDFIQKPLNPKSQLKKIFEEKIDYVDILEEGATLFALGYKGAGIKRILKATQIDKLHSDARLRGVVKYILSKIKNEREAATE